MNYSKIIPVLTEAIKEQQIQIDSLKKLINDGVKSWALKSAVVAITTTGVETNENLNQPMLYQNNPNPFNQTTDINYYLPETITSATLNVYNMSGSRIKVIAFIQKGKGSITINGLELNPGMYLYTLIVDGKEIDTKRMILNEYSFSSFQNRFVNIPLNLS
jgi:hypothetical protein